MHLIFSEEEANDYYDELCGNQGGRSYYDDDEGGMDYSISEFEQPFKDVLYELSQDMSTEELIKYIELFDSDELTERALEIGNGKVYAVQDALYTRKTHDNTGEKDFIVKERELLKLEKKYNIVCAYDDREKNIEMFKRHNIKAVKVHNEF